MLPLVNECIRIFVYKNILRLFIFFVRILIDSSQAWQQGTLGGHVEYCRVHKSGASHVTGQAGRLQEVGTRSEVHSGDVACYGRRQDLGRGSASDLLDSFEHQQDTRTDPKIIRTLHQMRSQITRQRLIRPGKMP